MIPRDEGGTDEIANAIPVCFECHLAQYRASRLGPAHEAVTLRGAPRGWSHFHQQPGGDAIAGTLERRQAIRPSS